MPRARRPGPDTLSLLALLLQPGALALHRGQEGSPTASQTPELVLTGIALLAWTRRRLLSGTHLAPVDDVLSRPCPPPYEIELWEGHAAERIVDIVADWLAAR